jgi:NAD-dependent deacetylase
MELSPELEQRIRDAEQVVVFTGAGVSKESGLDTFRDVDGVWAKVRPEDLATPEAFVRRPGHVWRWYGHRWEQMAAAGPNPAHRAIAGLEEVFPRVRVVTQNVDGLHQRAGSTDVVELHGTLDAVHCHRCRRVLEMEPVWRDHPEEPATCDCGGLFRPSVVWFGEMLPAEAVDRAFREAERCDLLLSVGTSALVFPAAGVIEVAHRAGAWVFEVNPESTGFSHLAVLELRQPAGSALPALLEAFKRCRRED